MRKFVVAVIVAVPLILSGLFITNSIISENFPLLRQINDESRDVKQTYQAGIEYCQNNYKNFENVNEQAKYENCIKLVEEWYKDMN